jgi:hypothetical protein
MHLEVIDANGNALSPVRSCARFLVFYIPFLLNGAPVAFGGPSALLGILDAVVVIGLGPSIVYLYVFNRRSRQSLHDLAVGSYVTRAPGSGPCGAPRIWRGHLAIAGAWCAAVAALTLVSPRLMKVGPFPGLLSVHERLMASGKLHSVFVTSGQYWFSGGGESKHSSFIESVAVVRERPRDYEEVADEIAATVLDTYPGIYGKDGLKVTIRYGYDIGIASSWTSRNFQHSPEEWRNLLKARK